MPTTAQVHDARAGEVHVPSTHVVEPPAARPRPRHHDRVDERGHDEAEDAVPSRNTPLTDLRASASKP